MLRLSYIGVPFHVRMWSVHLILLFLAGYTITAANKRFHVVYVFKVSKLRCNISSTFPRYILYALEQAVMTQPDCQVVMASNFGDCHEANNSVSAVPGVMLIDTVNIASSQTVEFANISTKVLPSDGRHELYITSALRFFTLLDVMAALGVQEILHVEADNMLYGNIQALLPSLRSGYSTSIAVTPLTGNKIFFTASVLWIPSRVSLSNFTDFLLEITRPQISPPPNATSLYRQYIKFLWPKACCRWGGPGHERDANGTLIEGTTGIKPFYINEMSLMAFYKVVYPTRLTKLAVVPQRPYNLNRWVCNMSEYGPGGREVGPRIDAVGVTPWGRAGGIDAAVKAYLFDPNSWGQFLGGTHKKKYKGFVDNIHVVGQAMGTTGCNIRMLCGNSSMYVYRNISSLVSSPLTPGSVSVGSAVQGSRLCYTAPFVYCGTFDKNTTERAEGNNAIVNLHVHSKLTGQFLSTPCACGG